MTGWPCLTSCCRPSATSSKTWRWGFLYQTDSKLAQIETLITNPLRGKEERSAALDLVVEAIITEARAKGFTHLMGYTTAQAIVDRAVKHGFEVEAEKYTQVLKLL